MPISPVIVIKTIFHLINWILNAYIITNQQVNATKTPFIVTIIQFDGIR